jgi:NTE family protein
MPWAVKTLLGFIGIDRQSDSSIVSYLLFEKTYTSALIDLGYKDAMEKIDELKDFFCLK